MVTFWFLGHMLHLHLVYSKLCNIMLVATKVHVILCSLAVLTWMCDKREVVQTCDIMELHKSNIAIMTIITMMTI